MIDAVRLSLSWMTVLPVGRGGVPDATAAGRAMTALPAVGLVCGATATALAHGAHALGAGALLSGVVGVGAALALTQQPAERRFLERRLQLLAPAER